MGEPYPSRQRDPLRPLSWVTLVLQVVAIVGTRAAWIGGQASPVVDPEARYNAAHALDVLHLSGTGHAWDALWALQYRPFCGGCTLDAAVGAGLFSVLPPTLEVWALVPVLLTGLAAAIALTLLLIDHGQVMSGPVGAVLWLSLPTLLDLSVIGWGNHYEASLALLVAWALAIGPRRPGRAAALGLSLGLGVWIGWAALPGALGLLAWWGWRERNPRRLGLLTAGLLVGLSPMLLRVALTGESPVATIYGEGELLPSVSRVWHNLQALGRPQQLAGLVGIRVPGVGQLLALLLLAATALSAWLTRSQSGTRAALAMAGAWVVVYLLVDFPLGIPDGAIPVAAEVRYAAPLLLALLCVVGGVGQGAETRYSAPPLARLAPLVGFNAWLVVGLVGWAGSLWGPRLGPHPRDVPAADWGWFQEQASSALSPDAHLAGARRGDDAPRAVHAYALGRQAVHDGLARADGALDALPALSPPDGVPAEAWARGVGAALVDLVDGTGMAGSTAAKRASDLSDRVLADPVLAGVARQEAVDRRPDRNER